jgi:hypothetical protein
MLTGGHGRTRPTAKRLADARPVAGRVSRVDVDQRIQVEPDTLGRTTELGDVLCRPPNYADGSIDSAGHQRC